MLGTNVPFATSPSGTIPGCLVRRAALYHQGTTSGSGATVVTMPSNSKAASEVRNGEMIAVVGDTHGHLQLALCVLARWQIELGAAFDAVLLCGDVGSFTDDEELDNATRAHAGRNPH